MTCHGALLRVTVCVIQVLYKKCVCRKSLCAHVCASTSTSTSTYTHINVPLQTYLWCTFVHIYIHIYIYTYIYIYIYIFCMCIRTYARRFHFLRILQVLHIGHVTMYCWICAISVRVRDKLRCIQLGSRADVEGPLLPCDAADALGR